MAERARNRDTDCFKMRETTAKVNADGKSKQKKKEIGAVPE